MKKLLSISLIFLLAVACVFAFTACNDEGKPSVDTPNDNVDNGVNNDESNDETNDETNKPNTDEHVHAFGDWTTTKEATCTEKGSKERSCSCGEKETQSIDMIAHTEVIDEAVDPTCTATGLTEGRHCSVCSTIIVAQATLSKKFHTSSEWIIDKAATKAEDGQKHTECVVCGQIMKEESIIAMGSLGLAYTVNTGGKACTITGIGECEDEEIYIPKFIDGYKVTTIGEKAFENCTDIIFINISESVTSIGERAFYGCTSLTEITIPESVTSIGAQVFYKASNLSTVYYNSSYCSQDNPFLNLSHITKIVLGGKTIPNSILKGNVCVKEVEFLTPITGIAYEMFSGCTSLKSITIPDSVTSIGERAFSGCTGLKSITIPDSVTSIGKSAFSRCSSLTSITIGNSVKSIGNSAFYNCTGLTSVTIPDSVTSIGDYAFECCSSLTSVTIGNSVTSIGWCAFYDCGSLTSVSIGNSVTKIDSFAFRGCTSLENVYITDLKEWCHISFSTSENSLDWESNPLRNGAKLYLNGTLITDLVIPNDITIINEGAFMGCTSLKSVTIPDTVTSIGNGAFSGCSSLTSITIPDSVTTIGYKAFYDCSSLTSITIPDSVTTIYFWTFVNCTDLTSITIPDSVTSIGDGAFHLCSSLTSINFQGTKAQWEAISKSSGWDSGAGSYTVYCTDGNITK